MAAVAAAVVGLIAETVAAVVQTDVDVVVLRC